jgi:uncharacterized cupin superfamily protein
LAGIGQSPAAIAFTKPVSIVRRPDESPARTEVRVFGRVFVSELKLSLNVAGSFENAAGGFSLPRDFAQADLETSSIPAAWFVSGQTRTRSKFLGKTRDRLAYAVYWECGAANFKWHYDKDEFLVILSGDAFVTVENEPERHYGASDFAFFPAGCDTTWHVPDHVRKIAILKTSVNRPVATALKAWSKLLEKLGLSAAAAL